MDRCYYCESSEPSELSYWPDLHIQICGACEAHIFASVRKDIEDTEDLVAQ